MANKNEANSTCVICGQKYHLCIACDRKKANWKPWKMFVDKENCYKIYKVLNNYNYKKITKDEARELLLKLDLSGLDTFKESIKKEINDILLIEKPVKTYRNKRKRNEEFEQQQEVVEVLEQQQEVVKEITESKIEVENKVEERQLEKESVEE